MEVEVLGTNKSFVWFRVQVNGFGVHKILTMPRAILPRGMAKAEIVEVDIDLDSIRHREPVTVFGGYTADLEVLRVVKYKEEKREPTSIG